MSGIRDGSGAPSRAPAVAFSIGIVLILFLGHALVHAPLARAAADSLGSAPSYSISAGPSSPVSGGSLDSLAGMPAVPEVRGPLSLTHAIDLAVSRSLTVSERSWTSQAEISRARDETRAANPTLELTDENFGGTVRTPKDEATLQISQPLRFGIRARRDVMSGLKKLSQYDRQAAQREVALAAGDAFVQAWWLHYRVAVLRRSEAVAIAAVAAARERTKIGAAPVVEILRAEATSATQTTERRRAE